MEQPAIGCCIITANAELELPRCCCCRLESTSIARALARKNDYKIIYNREIIGLGVANFFGAAFNSYTTTGELH
jgi:hypothetical protein